MKNTVTNAQISQKNKIYHDLIAKHYDKYQEVYHPKVKALYQELLVQVFSGPNFDSKKRLNILDIGCGTGYLEQYLRPETNRIKGIDISSGMLKIARKKFPSVRYVKADVFQTDINEKYDLIVENAFLHHLKDYYTVINRVSSHLSPKGCVFFGGEPNYYCYHYLSFLKNILRQHSPDYRAGKTDKVKDSLEKYAEYQMYFSDGINPYKLKQHLLDLGFKKVMIKFSSREFVAGLIDRWDLRLIDVVPNFLLDSTGILSRIFYLTAYK